MVDYECQQYRLEQTQQHEHECTQYHMVAVFRQNTNFLLIIQVDTEEDHQTADPHRQTHKVRGECGAVVVYRLHMLGVGGYRLFTVIGQAVQSLQLVVGGGQVFLHTVLGGVCAGL